jgi:ABC-type sugar transport system ATPase subunit
MNFVPAAELAHEKPPARAVDVGFRPEKTRLKSGPGLLRLGAGTVTLVEPLGASALVHLALGENEIVAETRAEEAPALDSETEVWTEPASLFFFDADGARVERSVS